MAMIECPECKTQVSSSAVACPNCGFAVSSHVAKGKSEELLGGCFLIGLVLASSFCCCGQVRSCQDEEAREEAAAQKASAFKQARQERMEEIKTDPEAAKAEVFKIISTGALVPARSKIKELKQAKVDTAELEEALEAKKAELEAEAAATAEEKRLAQIDKGLADLKGRARKERCDDWQATWSLIMVVRPDDEQYKAAGKATRILEKCRKAHIKDSVKIVRSLMKAQRENISEKIDAIFLESGLDVRVKTYSKDKTKIKMTNIMFGNRVIIKQFVDAGLLDILTSAGFVRATFSDGFDESFYYDLKPATEASEIKAGVLKDMAKQGLDKPLELAQPAETK
jgi:hypothetical protein